MSRTALAALASAALLAACAPLPPVPPCRRAARAAAMAAAPAPAVPGDWVKANDQLVVQGIPPIPTSVVQEVARYADFRGHGFVDWHPSRREMLVVHRKAGASTAQIHRLAAPMGQLEQITDFSEPVSKAMYEPLTGDSIVFERSTGGNEAAQIYRLDPATRQVTLVSEPDMRHDMAGWLNLSSRLIYSSVPLDRTAAGGRRDEIAVTLSVVDPANPAGRRKLAELPGGGWFPGAVSWDDRRLLLNRYLSANRSEVWLLDLGSGERTRVLPAAGSADKAVHLAGDWRRDNAGFFFVSDRSGEFRELMFYSLADGRITPITRHIKGDIEGSSVSADGKLLSVRAKIEGRTHLVFFDAVAFNELPSPALPEGSVTTVRFHPRQPVLAFALNSSKGPSQIGTLVPADGGSQAWTRPYAPPGVDTTRFAEQQIVRWKSFDGREITGIADHARRRASPASGRC